mmetsp:Transcript_25173/g.28682  ORF Transcript_25173/g.28682 Transcript_25173/m.28682 type:complete len:185 (-) Transcript_25173:217-771(-)
MLIRADDVSPEIRTATNFIAQESLPRRFPHLFHVVNQTFLDGISQAEALAGGGPAPTELFGGYACWMYGPAPVWWRPSIRHLNWKLVQGASGGPDAQNPMPPGSDNIIPPGENNGTYLLFDLKRDPREETDLSKAYPEILKKMIYRLKLYRKSFVYPQSAMGRSRSTIPEQKTQQSTTAVLKLC